MTQRRGTTAQPSPGPVGAGRRRLLVAWVVLLAVVVPVGSVLALLPQVVETGEVSHWPWEEHGFWGWWLVPLGLWLSVVPAALRHRPARPGRLGVLLLVLAAGTTLALLYNPR
ncbi:hypothetical protein [Jannaschia sp. R86511]|uniref:hypothetical protein n=1 Tax=Jannaschia sp. R86511 TaxID=3093853 RepID=UPI0036D3363E